MKILSFIVERDIMHNSEDIPNKIKDLTIDYLTGEISPEGLNELQKWIESSWENKRIFNHLRISWMLADAKQKDTLFNSEKSFVKIKRQLNESAEKRVSKVVSLRWKRFWAYAAVGLVCFAIGSLLTWVRITREKEYVLANTVITAPLGAKSVVNLPDGTKVWLNAGSKIEYTAHYGKDNRLLLLTGEAYFDVAKDKTRPFLVKTTQLTVRAVGTRFNVKAYPDEKTITTTLEEGKIEVESNIGDKHMQKVMLEPNQKIVYYVSEKQLKKNDGKENEKKRQNTPDAGNIEVSKNINTVLFTSWKDNRWILEGVSLGELATMMERRFNVTIEFDSEELQNYKFTGTIENETLEQILRAFKFTAPVDYHINKDKVNINLNTTLKEKYKHITSAQ